ncbi:cell surface protein SprA [Lentimicrobium saccharophilum]|uniref:Cell surface protein SprA n=2 Tax=Lentimicrobium TaxID=1840214 RepID=A0A0S7BZM4_9BACT|nr:cell surface protein SprA [Lentimicrobium saccharophilum]GAP42088.1 cell surface protein SprA [Lentimicrobium saccharophilum]
MERTIKYFIRLFALFFVVSIAWGIPVPYDLSGITGPETLPASPPDTTKPGGTLPYPLPGTEPGSLPEPSDKNKLFLGNTSNFTEEIIYDPATNTYSIVRKAGAVPLSSPTTLTFDEFKELDLDRSLQSYWREKAVSSGGVSRTGIIPQIHIGGQVFDRIFGGNTIDIRPQGSAEVTFGILSNRRDDPALDIRQRRTTNFDFQQRIQMSVMAKIGDKIEFNTNYNTEATFDFENKLKLKYEGKEDEIIKLIEAGDVTFPLNSTLITGSQSLFGLKTQMQFGRATVTGVFSQQKSETSTITVQGGAQTSKFSVRALDYEENKHFFLAQYFVDNYDNALSKLPIVNSNINITKIEVWITNIGPAVTDNRNLVALMDLGEKVPYNQSIAPRPGASYPDNKSNDLLSRFDTTNIRDINRVTQYLTGSPFGYVSGQDFEKVENARKLNPSEYTFNSKLGFISLNSTLNPDQVLAVAYQYTVIGQDSIFQVGEFSDQGISSPRTLMVKLLKSTALNTKIPMWNLMMKNVYNIGAFQLNREDFILNILYSGNENTVPTGYFTDGPEGVKGIPLLRLFNFDNLDPQQNPPHDGIFDFIDNAARQGGTIQASNGRVFFTVREPFGSYLRKKLDNQQLADKYCYDSLYTLTKSGAQQYPDKNRYILEGQYKSSSGSEISLNALNVPQGSVRVTAGGIPLTENVDYTVDYTLGRVKIINEGILNSGTPVSISLENNATFNLQTQTMMGMHVDYKVNNDFIIGATLLNLHERPLTQKTNFGQEPISNTMWGLDFNYQTESMALTKLIDKLPFYSTKTISRIQFNGEFAHFIPGHSRAVGKTGTSYIDDFEGAKSTIDLKNVGTWFLASTPQGQTSRDMFPEAAQGTGLAYGFNRAKLAWYTIDPLFYDRNSNLRPKNVSKDELSRNSVRLVRESEVFPNADPPNGQPMNLPVLNLAFFPEERGPYNYDVLPGSLSRGLAEDGSLLFPRTRWGGIMRKIESTDFEAANVEYIEFWLMDPFSEDTLHSGGDLYFNLGDISEDILRDGRKSYENGLPVSAEVKNVDTTIWGRVPTLQALVNAFDNDIAARPFQDVGYDGLPDADERSFFDEDYLQVIANQYGTSSAAYQQAFEDPSGDNYHFFRGADYDNDPKYSSVIERYKMYNGVEGNSPATEQSNEQFQTQATTLPNVEDINRDNTLNEQERYFQYKIRLTPDRMNIGENYITDIFNAGDIPLENGKRGNVKWYQFKVPVQSPDEVVGNIQDFKSIRFMRMFLRNFDQPVVLRFATLELVRGEWRKYYSNLLAPGEYIPNPNQSETSFDISTVSIEENGSRSPIPYVLPPDIEREINVGTTNYQRLNEQAMVLKVCNLLDGDARGTYKTTDFDFRQYKKLKMYIHAEKAIENQELAKGDVTVFIRMGSDFTENYYEYEVPVEMTPWYTTAANPGLIWPDANRLDIELDKLVKAKQQRNDAMGRPGSMVTVMTPYEVYDGENRITVVGMPSMSDVKAFMIGVRNPKKQFITDNDDGESKCVEVWVNELRLTDFDEKSGFAATARIAANLADLGNVVLSGSYSTAGFGSIEKKVNERQQEAVGQVDVATNIQLGKFFPEKAGIKIPMHIDYSEMRMTPKYDPLDPDILMSEVMNDLERNERDSVRNKVQDITRRTNINFVNMRKEKVGAQGKTRIYDIENFDFTYAYSEIFHRNIDIEYDSRKQFRGGIGYNFLYNPKPVKPFQNVKFLQSKSLAIIKDFNFFYMPKMFGFRTDMNRQYNERLLRNKSDALIILEPTYTKSWDWNRLYDLKFDLAQSLKLEYQANANAYISEPPGQINRTADDWQAKRDSIWDEIMNFGSMNRFTQNMNLNYIVPINKIPLLNWISLNARYASTFRWEASPRSIQSIMGNTIENSNTININGSARMTNLYNKWSFLRKIGQQGRSQSPQRPGQAARQAPKEPDPQQTAAQADTTAKKSPQIAKALGIGIVKLIIGIKDVQFTYSESQGTLLPGFMPQPDILGSRLSDMAPGFGFAFGSQEDIRSRAVRNQWLTTDTLLNSAYITRATKNLNARITYEPFPEFRVEFTAEKKESFAYQEYFKANANGEFTSTSPQDRGSFSISFYTLKTAFKKDGEENINEVFENFKDYRIIIAKRLSELNPNSMLTDTFPSGYGSGSQDVIIPAFIAAYTGRDPMKVSLSPFPKIPIPNWRFSYTGLSKIPYFKQYLKNLTISHAYLSTYSIGNYVSNVDYLENLGFQSALDFNQNFIPKNQIDAIAITEQFSPLINFDMTWNNSLLSRFEIKKARSLQLSFVNNQVTEVRSNELIIGVGYRFKDVKLNLSSGGRRQQLKSDLNVKLDLSVRDNKTVLRRLDEEINQISTGNRMVSINSSADYVINQRFNVRLFFDKTITNPFVSSQFPNSTTNAGVSLRFTLAQ